VALEAGLPTAAAVTTTERRLVSNAGWGALSTPWTFGRSFRLLFGVVSLLGIGGAVATTYLGIHRTSLPKATARFTPEAVATPTHSMDKRPLTPSTRPKAAVPHSSQ
jgi:hypothetical protein